MCVQFLSTVMTLRHQARPPGCPMCAPAVVSLALSAILLDCRWCKFDPHARRLSHVPPGAVPLPLFEAWPDRLHALNPRCSCRLSHVRPGTVSLALSAASPEDEDAPRPSRARTAFYVTTGGRRLRSL